MSRISQREARRLRKRVAELERMDSQRRVSWAQDWPGGVHIGTEENVSEKVRSSVQTARRLGHAVVVKQEDQTPRLHFYALVDTE